MDFSTCISLPSTLTKVKLWECEAYQTPRICQLLSTYHPVKRGNPSVTWTPLPLSMWADVMMVGTTGSIIPTMYF
jgi:hypothetical protein